MNGDAGGTGAWNNDYDERLKKDIVTISNALTKVQALRGVNYQWKDTTTHDTGLQMGFIAQETEKVIPEVVDAPKNDSSYYSMQYAPITALLVEAIKEQQKIIEQQKAKINSLEASVADIEKLKAANEEMKAQFANLESLLQQLTGVTSSIGK